VSPHFAAQMIPLQEKQGLNSYHAFGTVGPSVTAHWQKESG